MNALLAVVAAVLFIGDSVTSKQGGYVEMVGGGERAITYHLDTSIATLQNAPHYSRIVVEIGVHAVKGCDEAYKDNPGLFARDYARLLNLAVEHADEVVVVNIPWLNWGPKRAARAMQLNEVIRHQAALRHLHVVDAWGAMYQCGTACIAEDGFHPNSEGHGRIASLFPVRQEREVVHDRSWFLSPVVRGPLAGTLVCR